MRKLIIFLGLVILLLVTISAQYEKSIDEQGNIIIIEGEDRKSVV